jgi:processive 1,2-diacylglycerol beta-glucosyltransferase
VIVNPIPGQEDCNSDYLLENGAALKANHPSSLSRKLNFLLESRDRLLAMQAAARRLGTPRAAYEVARRSLELIGVTASSAKGPAN